MSKNIKFTNLIEKQWEKSRQAAYYQKGVLEKKGMIKPFYSGSGGNRPALVLSEKDAEIFLNYKTKIGRPKKNRNNT